MCIFYFKIVHIYYISFIIYLRGSYMIFCIRYFISSIDLSNHHDSFLSIETGKPKRFQGAFTTKQIMKIESFLKNTQHINHRKDLTAKQVQFGRQDRRMKCNRKMGMSAAKPAGSSPSSNSSKTYSLKRILYYYSLISIIIFIVGSVMIW